MEKMKPKMASNSSCVKVLRLSRNAKTKHDICHIGNVGAQCFASAFNKACAQRTP